MSEIYETTSDQWKEHVLQRTKLAKTIGFLHEVADVDLSTIRSILPSPAAKNLKNLPNLSVRSINSVTEPESRKWIPRPDIIEDASRILYDTVIDSYDHMYSALIYARIGDSFVGEFDHFTIGDVVIAELNLRNATYKEMEMFIRSSTIREMLSIVGIDRDVLRGRSNGIFVTDALRGDSICITEIRYDRY